VIRHQQLFDAHPIEAVDLVKANPPASLEAVIPPERESQVFQLPIAGVQDIEEGRLTPRVAGEIERAPGGFGQRVVQDADEADDGALARVVLAVDERQRTELDVKATLEGAVVLDDESRGDEVGQARETGSESTWRISLVTTCRASRRSRT